MGGTTGLMSIGLRAMVANYAALQTTGHNIANAGVDGYSRQQVELGTSMGQFSGSGFIGKGVDVQTVSRVHNEYLTREAATARSLASMDAARHESLQDLEKVFPIGETGIGYAASQFLNSMTDWASRPSDIAARQVVLARASDLATRFAAAGNQLDTIQTMVGEKLTTTVNTVNSLTRSIAEVNQKIAGLKGLGQPANDLLDERDRLVSDLSEHVQVTTIPADDGTLGVFAAGGQRLVLRNQAAPIRVVSDPQDPSRSALAIVESGFERVLLDGSLGGGSLAGMLQFQNDDLVAARSRIGQMAAALGSAINAQQADGLDLTGTAGTDIFRWGDGQVVPNTQNQRDGTGAYLASVGMTIVDPSQLQASEYTLAADPANTGGWLLTRESDGHVQSVVDGQTVDGFTISLGTPAPASVDRFRLKPVSAAATGMQRILDDPRGLAAALPVTATAGSGNQGTARVGSLTASGADVDVDRTASIVFNSDSGDYDWELRDRTTNAVLSSGSGTWTAGQPIELNGFSLQLTGVPKSGDTFGVAKTEHITTSNGNALAMVALRDQALVGRVRAADGSFSGGLTVSDAYASAMADVGVRVQGAGVMADVSATVASNAEQARSAVSGVNLDEEAARLLAYQQSYQAAAKVLQVAQSIFDTLLETARA